ncbi:PREDICTED: uncharacterized protein LOC108545288 [Eufriesea mexicana]|uniref:uncharacterized protein LOC108545288 n=1 Tax=Eufriesea mexicana TaxID=516756 RepID=UPI00083BE24B|nr:PREDICTED: uncharacterized protein LOC108545288 [Eufriesea mexicana]
MPTIFELPLKNKRNTFFDIYLDKSSHLSPVTFEYSVIGSVFRYSEFLNSTISTMSTSKSPISPDDHEFVVPKKSIKVPSDMTIWEKSEAYCVRIRIIHFFITYHS